MIPRYLNGSFLVPQQNGAHKEEQAIYRKLSQIFLEYILNAKDSLTEKEMSSVFTCPQVQGCDSLGTSPENGDMAFRRGPGQTLDL